MAEHKVQLPDNSIITVEGPEDATEQELIDFAKQHYASKQSQDSSSAPTASSLIDKAKHMDALTFGGGAAALAGGALLGAKSLKDRFFNQESKTPIDYSKEPVMGSSPEEVNKPPANKPMDWESSLNEEDRKLLERSRVNAAAKAVQSTPTAAPITAPVVAPEVVPTVQSQNVANPKIPALLQAPVVGAVEPPVAAVAPVAAPVAPPEVAPVVAAPVEPVAAAPVEVAPAPAEAAPEVAKTTKAPKSEYFEGYKKLPGTERQLLGTLGVAKDVERAKALVNALKSTLPEGAALEFPKTEAGVSKGGMPNPQDVMSFTNKHLGTDMKLDEKGKFPADFKFTEENLTKMHQSVLDEYANAKTPAAKAAAEKGFATLRSLVGLAGFGALAYGSLEAYKHGKKTGDWTPAGELGLNTVAGAINPALMLGTHMTGLNAGEEQELAKRRYNAMIGGGRGVAPPSAYQR